jgi:hypothetical protein
MRTPKWQLTRVRSSCPHFEARGSRPSRTKARRRGGGPCPFQMPRLVEVSCSRVVAGGSLASCRLSVKRGGGRDLSGRGAHCAATWLLELEVDRRTGLPVGSRRGPGISTRLWVSGPESGLVS